MIRSGMISDETSRGLLVGVWELDEESDLPPGSNQIMYLEDGWYLNPFRNVVLIGTWSATRTSITMTPIDLRNLQTGKPAPEMKEVLAFIKWGRATATAFTWSDRDHFQEAGNQPPRRRAKAVIDVEAIHAAWVNDRLIGSWLDDRGVNFMFADGGRYAEQMSGAVLAPGEPGAEVLSLLVTGTYRVDQTAGGVLERTIEGVNTSGDLNMTKQALILESGRTSGITRTGPRPAAPVLWHGPDEMVIDGRVMKRQAGGR